MLIKDNTVRCYGFQQANPLRNHAPKGSEPPNIPARGNLNQQFPYHIPACSLTQVKVFPYQSQSIKSGRGDSFSNFIDTYATGIMKNQGNMTPSKEHSKFPVNDPKEMEIQELPDKESKIVVIKMLTKLEKI